VKQIGRYRVIRPLAAGGMGQVFLAEDPQLERQVALKLLFRDPDRGLRREAKTLAALSHPNIVTIFEIGEHEAADFIAMEYLPGKTLRDLLTGDRPSREELVAIVQSVAVAVAAAHKAGILHRDIKPENVVTTPNGVKVVDFGIARRLDARPTTTPDDLYELLVTPGPSTATTLDLALPTTRDTVASAGTHTVFGTPAYMAPEVLGGEPSSEASDVYSLGVMLHECLAGRRPYDAGNLIETIAHIIQAPPPTLDDPLNPLLVRMLAREPAMRPTLPEIISALRPSEAPPPAVVAPRGKPWWLLGVAVGVIGFAVAGVVALRDRGEDEPFVRTAPEPPLVELRLGVAGVDVGISTWGLFGADRSAVAGTLARALRGARGAKVEAVVIAGKTLAAELAAAREARVDQLVVMRIDEDPTKDGAEIVGTLALYDPKTGQPLGEPWVQRAQTTQVRALEYALLDALLARLAPLASLPRVHDRAAAVAAVEQGRTSVANGNFDRARTEFEAAVASDPGLPEAWYGLALAASWTEAPEDLTLQASDRAFELAPAGRRKELMRGAALYMREQFREAREVLAKIEAAGDAGPDELELLYFLGEANWHDGRFEAGVEYFRRALELPPHSRAMAIHPTQYLVARRQGDEARYLTGAAGFTDTNQIDFATRNYRKLLAGPDASYRLMSKLVLGQPVSDQERAAVYGRVPIEHAALEAALAIEAGDRAKASRVFDRMFAEHLDGKRLTSGDFYQIEYAGEVAVAGGLVDEARRIVKLLAEHSARRPRRGYHRLAMLTAALARDASMIPSGPTVTERWHQLEAAARAEIAGDPAKAARLFREVVDNPATSWDYPERAALIRNLRAAADTAGVEALCKDTLEPAIYRQAFVVLRGLCRRR